MIERFVPTKDSVRWEVEIRGAGAPWTTDIATRLKSAACRSAQVPRAPPELDRPQRLFWTAWSDPGPARRAGTIRSVFRPLGRPAVELQRRPGRAEPGGRADLATIVEPAADIGL